MTDGMESKLKEIFPEESHKGQGWKDFVSGFCVLVDGYADLHGKGDAKRTRRAVNKDEAQDFQKSLEKFIDLYEKDYSAYLKKTFPGHAAWSRDRREMVVRILKDDIAAMKDFRKIFDGRRFVEGFNPREWFCRELFSLLWLHLRKKPTRHRHATYTNRLVSLGLSEAENTEVPIEDAADIMGLSAKEFQDQAALDKLDEMYQLGKRLMHKG